MNSGVSVVASLLVGVLIGALIFGSDRAPEMKPAPALPKSTPSKPTDIATSPREKTSEVVNDPARSSADDDNDLLARAIASIPFDEEPAAEGEIRGVVLTTSGKPVKGARVRATDRAGWDPVRMGRDSTLEERVRVYILNERLKAAHTLQTTTDDAGEFIFAGTGSQEYRVSVDAPGFLFPGGDRVLTLARSGDQVEIIGEEAAVVHIELLGDSPEALEDVLVWFDSTGAYADGEYWDPETPFITLPAGEYRVEASNDRFTSETVTMRVHPGKQKDVSLFMRELPSLTGQIIVPDDELPRSRYSVHLFPRDTPLPIDDDTWDAMRRLSRGTRYTLLGLELGSYWLSVDRNENKGRHSQSLIPVEIREGVNTVDFTLDPVDRSAAIRLTVVDPQGHDVLEPRVVFYVQSDGKLIGGGVPTLVPLKDGSFWAIFRKSFAAIHQNAEIKVSASSRDCSGEARVIGGWGSAVKVTLAPE